MLFFSVASCLHFWHVQDITYDAHNIMQGQPINQRAKASSTTQQAAAAAAAAPGTTIL